MPKPVLPLSPRRSPARRALYESQETVAEALGVAAQLERAERFGHRFAPDEPGLPDGERGPTPRGSAPARGLALAASAPLQRLRTGLLKRD